MTRHKKEKICQEIDYNVLDYNVKRPDILVMGWRLTMILGIVRKELYAKHL